MLYDLLFIVPALMFEAAARKITSKATNKGRENERNNESNQATKQRTLGVGSARSYPTFAASVVGSLRHLQDTRDPSSPKRRVKSRLTGREMC